ncbi:hypothetical protein LPJ78_005235 [Coemansia sp. RSA 989]|nr:hypothetical protein BX667DRAFT_487432 [Coemansia mojavensis]KAJ1738984.1 hypothetical protein LPJ68_005073 [Coemansia sp. RSA 1086]KAJ1747515.1 hypothetical protein LPJ79_005190 [Coemansia sp. RSA 1821]KAJ1861610.1 hypothetical protein LPJ78_005235 [Coemansia sp. RSA 989]KAJ1869546.1 hypothetical protein LPJ55_005296 [Coemansia sp. RSA 990]KAJ2667882.1 hypothetical protein IWW42_005627 [Coemansia sp. RSA 1085]
MSKLVAIVGATGLQGGSVLKTLYASNKYKLRALTRNPDGDSARALVAKYPGIELAQANLDDLESLQKSFVDADIVFGMTDWNADIIARTRQGDVDAEYKQGKNIVDAAISAGVKTMVFSVLDSLSKQSNGKYPDVTAFEAKYKVGEYLLSNSDKIDGFTICLGAYMDNFIRGAHLAEDGRTVEFWLPVEPTLKIPLVDTINDTGPVVEYILDHPDECRGKVQDVSCGYYEVQEMINAFTEATGRPARYVKIPYESIPLPEVAQMYKCIEEFGPFCNRSEFIERNLKMKHKFTTPVEYWKNRGWAGPTK